MQNLSKEICLKLKAARRELGLTQSELAAEVGCKQAALSMFESGLPTKLSDETVRKLAARLNVDLNERPAATAAEDGFQILPMSQKKGFCPDSECPSNFPYLVGGRLVFRPHLAAGKHCAHCGELLESRCPSCGAPLNEGAFCSACGANYVQPPPVAEDLRAYVTRRQNELERISP